MNATDAATDPQVETPHELVLTNTFPVARSAVWRAWTDPAEFAAWWVGAGWTTSDVVLEARPRGRFHAVQTADDGSFTMAFDGFYREVEPEQTLVFTLTEPTATPDDEARTVLTVRLREVDGATVQEFRQTGVITDEHFAALEAGTISFFDQLAAHLAR